MFAVRSLSQLLLTGTLFLCFGLGGGAICEARRPPSTKKSSQETGVRSYILVKDIHQWLDFDYEYDYLAVDSWSAYGATSSHDLLLENTYHFDTQYAVLRPKLLMGTLDIDIGFDWEWEKDEPRGSDTGTNPVLEYHLDGTFFKDERYPISFTSYYTKDMVNRVFSSNYNTDQRGESLNVSYQYPSLLTQIGVSQSEGKTSGLTQDRTSTFQQAMLNSTHRYQDWCATSINLMKGVTDTSVEMGDEQNADWLSLSVDNNLDFSKKYLLRYLESQYSYSDSTSEYGNLGRKIEDFNTNSIWTERLYWQLGRALYSGLDYKDIFFESSRSEQKSQLASGWLRHRLFDNFMTHFRMNDRESQYVDGTESALAGELNFNYSRHLPRESNLSLGLAHAYGVTDRSVMNGLTQVVDTTFLYDATRFNYLNDYDIRLETIVVRNRERTIVYDEGADYTVEKIGRQTRLDIPQGSAISDGDQLSIDYEYLTNPNIKYANQVNSLHSSLSLFENRYRVAGQVSRGNQDLLEGSDQNVSLINFTEYMGSIETNFGFYTLKCLYRDFNSTNDIYHLWEPSLQYRRNFTPYRFSAQIRGRQTEYEEVTYRGMTSTPGTENSLFGGVNVTKRLVFIPGATWENKVDCLWLNGRGEENTEVSVNSALQIAMGKSRIRLEGEVSWEDDNGQASRDAFVLLQFRRFFRSRYQQGKAFITFPAETQCRREQLFLFFSSSLRGKNSHSYRLFIAIQNPRRPL